MYLEISERQTGKTRRLLKMAENHLSYNGENVCIFFVHKEEIGRNLSRELLPGFVGRVKFKSIHSVASELRGFDLGEKTLIIIDEFDFVPEYLLKHLIEILPSLDNLAVASTLRNNKTFRDYVNYVKKEGNTEYCFWRFMEETDFTYTTAVEMSSKLPAKRFFSTTEMKLDIDIMKGIEYNEAHRT